MPSISPASKARLLRELSRLSNDPPPGIAAYTDPSTSDMTSLRAQITGPEGSPFEGGVFLLTVSITGRYPFEPPRCRFLTPLYHPNIDAGGRICLDTLKSPPAGSWSPAVSLPSLLLSIRSLMAEPNPDDGLVPEISDLYKRNPSGWENEARRRTSLEATVEKLEEVERGLDRESSGGEKNTHAIDTDVAQAAAEKVAPIGNRKSCNQNDENRENEAAKEKEGRALDDTNADEEKDAKRIKHRET
eukprot:scaffold3507_cov188-Alexandrium_tamarense.AAC.9